ncbi:MAG: cysteine rich repeat-containing protein, partial [Xanthobacteraceae bacterium]
VAPLGPIPPMRPRDALAILAVCRAEQQSLCSGIPIGGGRILSCLADHAPQLSLECYQALARATR